MRIALKIKYYLTWLIIIYCSAGNNQAQPKDITDKASTILSIISNYHYQPIQNSDTITQRILIQLQYFLDPNKTIFQNQDIQQLDNIKQLLQDKNKLKFNTFLTQVQELYSARLNEAKEYLQKLAITPIHFSQKDTIFFKYSNFPDNEKVWHQRWERRIKHKILYEWMIAQSDTNINRQKQKLQYTDNRFLKKATAKEIARIDRILNHSMGYEKYIEFIFLNCICSSFDPHTMYFTPNYFDDFKNSLSGKEYTFGMYINENKNGEIEIEKVIPGSPAWKCNAIHKNDVILKIQKKEREDVDFTIIDKYEAIQILNDPLINKATFTLRKKNGIITTVLLEKEKITNTTDIVKSFILKGTKKIGYISLPDFYTRWDEIDVEGCANDVAEEIIRLQNEGIAGLIIDIRNNGGGSLSETSKLAGIFIDEGPLWIIRNKSAKPKLEKDKNRGLIYQGPLLLLVNKASASASEILAGVMQDYNRAIIAGNNTFGKFSGQIILPLDTTTIKNNSWNHSSSNGFIKITNLKNYRLNGTTGQNIGIKPDIEIPEIMDLFYPSEAEYLFPLNNDSIIKNVVYQPSHPLPIKELQQQSSARMQKDTLYSELKILQQKINLSYKANYIVLEPQQFAIFYNANQEIIEKYDSLITFNHKVFEIIPKKADEKLYSINPYEKEISNFAIKELMNDYQLKEAFYIINDLIYQENLNK